MMNEIPLSSDKISALITFISANSGEQEGDVWIFYYDPMIITFLNKFNAVECERLTSSIQEMDAAVLIHLADPVSECSNPYLDGHYCYCQIFLLVEEEEALEYLIQNLTPAVDRITTPQPIAFYQLLLTKTKKLNSIFDNNYPFVVQTIEQKIKELFTQ